MVEKGIGYSADVAGDDAINPERCRVGLCFDCQYARRIESARGSIFYRCARSATDSGYAKYPRLPVLQCAGYTSCS